MYHNCENVMPARWDNTQILRSNKSYGEILARGFSRLPMEMKWEILKGMGQDPREIARALMNMELVSKEWREVASDLWALLVGSMPQEERDTAIEILRLLGRKEDPKSIYLLSLVNPLLSQSHSGARFTTDQKFVLYARNDGPNDAFLRVAPGVVVDENDFNVSTLPSGEEYGEIFGAGTYTVVFDCMSCTGYVTIYTAELSQVQGVPWYWGNEVF